MRSARHSGAAAGTCTQRSCHVLVRRLSRFRASGTTSQQLEKRRMKKTRQPQVLKETPPQPLELLRLTHPPTRGETSAACQSPSL